MSNIVPFPRSGGCNHHGAGGFNHHGVSLEYWWEVPSGSIPLPLLTGKSRKDAAHWARKVAIEEQIFEALLDEEGYLALLQDVPAELCKPKGAILCCSDGETLWFTAGRRWKSAKMENGQFR